MSALPPIATEKADMPQLVISALHPKADMCSAVADVCFGPKADIAAVSGEVAPGLRGRQGGPSYGLLWQCAGCDPCWWQPFPLFPCAFAPVMVAKSAKAIIMIFISFLLIRAQASM